MAALTEKLLFASIRATSGMAGLLSLLRCGTGSCTTCHGCAGVGIVLCVLALIAPRDRNESGGIDDNELPARFVMRR